MDTTLRSERGSVLIIAVVAMLVMGVLSVSFALLANIETTIGVNYKQQAQAEALAEAGLERARDALRTAASEPCAFTRWTDSGSAGAGCGSYLGSLLFNNLTLGPGQYSAVVNNDCSPLVPTAIEDTECTGATPAKDGNETAVITAFATAGTGRSRVRALMGIDNVWKHVCSAPEQDLYCNDPSNTNGNPTIEPQDPNEYPGGPAVFDDLPRPILGCSRIDPTLHGATVVNCTNPLFSAMYPFPYPVGAPRFVIMGQDPAVTASAKTCNGGGQVYFGYFDCALTTPCPAGVCGGAARPACVRTGDGRIDGVTYKEAVGGICPVGATGMVYVGAGSTSFNLPNIGAGLGDERTIYILNGTATVQNKTIYGTLVVEGLDTAPQCPERDAELKNGTVIWTGPASGAGTGIQYGYPLGLLGYNPDMAPPTATAPQGTCADMGSASGTALHGVIYWSGRIEVNPFLVDGGIIAFDIHAQGSSSTYQYNYKYGDDAPPPGFPAGSGTQVVVVRKSFIVCTTYADDSGGGSVCP